MEPCKPAPELVLMIRASTLAPPVLDHGAFERRVAVPADHQAIPAAGTEALLGVFLHQHAVMTLVHFQVQKLIVVANLHAH